MKFVTMAAVAVSLSMQFSLSPVTMGSAAWAQGTAPAGMTQTEKDAQANLEKAGYSQVRDVKSTKDGITAKATKDGKQVSVVVDSSGKIKEMP